MSCSNIRCLEGRHVRLSFILILLVYNNTFAQHRCPVIPLPASCEQVSDIFKFNKGTSIIIEDTSLRSLAFFLRQSLRQYKEGETKIGDKNKANAIWLEKKKVPDSGETYSLRMTKRAIVVSAPSEEGIFDGIITLLQLIRQSPAGKSGIALGCWNIQDTARFRWRGLMLDESRHFSGKKAVKMLLDWMAFYKLNRFHWHLTDETAWRLEIKQYPRLTTIGGVDHPSDPASPSEHYTDADIEEIVNYAKDRYITVIPEIDMPGHATAANRAYPEFSGGGRGRFANFTFNPGKKETYSYLTAILRETAGLFPSKMIHLGGDEVALGSKGWKNNPDIEKLMLEENLADAKAVEFYFIHKMTDSALSIYNKVMLWDEAVDASLPVDSTIIFWWRHDLTGQLTKALQKGYDVVLCPRVPLYFDFVQDSTHRLGRKWNGDFNSLDRVYHFPDRQIDSIVGNNPHVLGLQANLWTEDVKSLPRLEFLLFPRIAALSEAAWTKSSDKNYPQFLNRVKRHLVYYQNEGIFYYNPLDPGKTPEIL